MKLIGQIVFLVLLAFVTGLLANAFSPNPLPLLAPAEQFHEKIADDKKIHESEITSLWESGEALFIDARAEEFYKLGHIPGAFSIPYKSFDSGTPELIEILPRDQLLVIYCDGADCHASHVVAEKLLELGFQPEKVKVFSGGWAEWQRLGGEIAKEVG